MADNEQKQQLLQISNPPHIRSGESVPKVMWAVVIALAPASVFSVYLFGLNAFILLSVGVVAAVIGEAGMQLFLKRPVTVTDGSAVVTGLLLAMNVPPLAPWWVVAIGSLFAIIVVKQFFGGLGFNIFNPALAGRAFLMASWPIYMTTAWHRFGGVNVLSPAVTNTAGLPESFFDTLTMATPLGLLKEGPKIAADSGIDVSAFYDILLSPKLLKSLFIGNIGGCIGETSALLLLAGGLFLLFRRIITWHIPVSYVGTVAILAAIYYS
ncbi:MAG: RnfABCDGE type electron transport complex subunit D, partial [Chrysiogenales bacterium]